MKLTSIAAIAVLALLTSTQAFAWGGHSKKDIKVLNESADALQPINADLSSRLRDYANKEQMEMQAGRKAGETSTHEAEDVQLVRDSAAALKGTRPDLSKKLDKFAEKEVRMEKRHTGRTSTRGMETAPSRQTTPRSGENNPPAQTPGGNY